MQCLTSLAEVRDAQGALWNAESAERGEGSKTLTDGEDTSWNSTGRYSAVKAV